MPKQGLAWCARAESGQSRGRVGERNKVHEAVGYLPKSTPPCGLRAPLQSLATARVHERRWGPKEGRGEERNQRMRGCADEGMWTNGHPFIHLSGLSVVTVTVSTEQPFECRRSADKFTLEFCVSKATTSSKNTNPLLASKDRMDD